MSAIPLKPKLLDAAFVAAEKAMTTARTGDKEAIQAALLAAKEAVEKANTANEKRFENVNEFRGQLADIQSTLISRNEAETHFRSLDDKNNIRFAAIDAAVARIQSSVDKSSAADGATNDSHITLRQNLRYHNRFGRSASSVLRVCHHVFSGKITLLDIGTQQNSGKVLRMKIYGAWVGWGLGDWSHLPDGTDRDPTVRRAKALMRRKFPSYAGNLADTNVFDEQMATAVFTMQGNYVKDGKLRQGEFYWGILDMPTQIVMGFTKPAPATLPIIFTAEGHMSDMFIGPAAFTAQTLEAQQVCHWKPLWYNNRAMPFDNKSLERELHNQLSRTEIQGPVIDGKQIMWPFPAGTSYGIIDFSQGVIGVRELLMRDVLPEGGALHWRAADLRRSLSFGSPYREFDQIAPWVPDPPDTGTQGISDRRFNATQLVLPNGKPVSTIHREHGRHGDLYTENQVSEAGQKKTAIYKAVQGKFTGSGSLLNEALEIFTDPMASIFPVVQAIWTGGMFLFNMGPHGTYDLAPCVEWMRGVRA